MKARRFVSILVLIICLSGCSSSLSGRQTQKSNVQGDWPFYDTADEIVEVSSNIYSGKVTDISFEIIDITTGEVYNPSMGDSARPMLHTVYTIQVEESFKGKDAAETKLCLYGGLPGYKEDEQYELLKTYGLISDDEVLAVCPETSDVSLNVNESYLFCTTNYGENYDFIINPLQFAYPESSVDAKVIAAQASLKS